MTAWNFLPVYKSQITNSKLPVLPEGRANNTQVQNKQTLTATGQFDSPRLYIFSFGIVYCL